MKQLSYSKTVGLLISTMFAVSGCVTKNGTDQDYSPSLTPAEQVGGQATTVTTEGQVKHEEVCVPEAETGRVQAPSVEVGLSRKVTDNSLTQPYTRFNCR